MPHAGKYRRSATCGRRFIETLEPRQLLSASGVSTFFSSNAQPLADDAIGRWTFSESAGSSTADATGNGNTGTLVNGPKFQTGPNGNALLMNGSNQYVRVNDAPALNPTNAITISVWVD